MSRESVDHAPLGRSSLPAEKRCTDSKVTNPGETKDPLGSGELGRFVNQTKSTHQSTCIQRA